MLAVANGCVPSVETLLGLDGAVDVTLRDHLGETARTLASLCKPCVFCALRALLPFGDSPPSGLVLSDGVLTKHVERLARVLLPLGSGIAAEILRETTLTAEFGTMPRQKWHLSGWTVYDASTFFLVHERVYHRLGIQRINGRACLPGEGVPTLQPSDCVKLCGVNRWQPFSQWQVEGWELTVDEETEVKLCHWGIRRNLEVVSTVLRVEEEAEDLSAEIDDFFSAFAM